MINKYMVGMCVGLMLLLSGCENIENYYDSDYKGQPIKLQDNFYVKKIRVQNIDIMLECDANGNYISGTSISGRYNVGKQIQQFTTVTPKMTQTYHFECDKLEECQNQMEIVKKVIKESK